MNSNELNELKELIENGIIISVKFEYGYPYDDSYRSTLPVHQQVEYDRLVELWKQWIPMSSSKTNDPVLFLEQAYLLDAAIRTYGEEHVYVSNGFKSYALTQKGAVLNTVDALTLVDKGMRLYGVIPPLPKHGFMDNLSLPEYQMAYTVRSKGLHGDSAAEWYYDMLNEELLKRKTTICGYGIKNKSPYADLIEVVVSQYLKGQRDWFLKDTNTRNNTLILHLNDGLNKEEARRHAEVKTTQNFAHLEGLHDTIFLQEYKEASYEYRFFVFEGNLVSGAGCISDNTPLRGYILDSCGEPFYPKYNTRAQRKSDYYTKNRLVTNEGPYAFADISRILKEHYIPLAQKTIDHLRTLPYAPRSYTLDVAFDEKTGEAFVIGIDSLNNSRLYANNPLYLVEGIRVVKTPMIPIS